MLVTKQMKLDKNNSNRESMYDNKDKYGNEITLTNITNIHMRHPHQNLKVTNPINNHINNILIHIVIRKLILIIHHNK